MNEKIFLISGGKLVEMDETTFFTEDEFQHMLVEYPSLLAGSQINVENPRRWILIKREMGIPDSENTGNRWSIDHLFIDQEGIPTFVEVKRQSDTRLRREVVGQMLDYAANAVNYWSIERLKVSFEEQNSKGDKSIESILEEFLDEDSDAESFWEEVETNLRLGKIRLLFEADRIPKELKAIIEFLNQQMNYTEVLGLELKQYSNNETRTIVPRIIGQTSVANQTKKSSSSNRKKWNEEMFIQELKPKLNNEQYHSFQKLYKFMLDSSDKLNWGTGAVNGYVGAVYNNKCKNRSTFSIKTDGTLRFDVGWLYNTPEKQPNYMERIKAIHDRTKSIPNKGDEDIPIEKWYERVDVTIEEIMKYKNN